MSVEFLDTNVLVYALDPTTPDKHHEAKTLVARLATEGTGGLSVQVLQELVWVMTRKVPRPLTMTTALSVVEKLMLWPVFSPNAADVLLAGRLAERGPHLLLGRHDRSRRQPARRHRSSGPGLSTAALTPLLGFPLAEGASWVLWGRPSRERSLHPHPPRPLHVVRVGAGRSRRSGWQLQVSRDGCVRSTFFKCGCERGCISSADGRVLRVKWRCLAGSRAGGRAAAVARQAPARGPSHLPYRLPVCRCEWGFLRRPSGQRRCSTPRRRRARRLSRRARRGPWWRGR